MNYKTPFLYFKKAIVKHAQKFSLYGSFGLAMYKAFDYRKRYLKAEDVKEILHTALDSERDENDKLRATYNDILLNISLENYSINDIKLPFCYQVYDVNLGKFRMIKFNKAYEEKYGDNPSEYFAKTNEEVKGKIGKEWENNNHILLGSSGQPMQFRESAVLKDGTVVRGKYIKWIVEKETGTYLFMIEIN